MKNFHGIIIIIFLEFQPNKISMEPTTFSLLCTCSLTFHCIPQLKKQIWNEQLSSPKTYSTKWDVSKILSYEIPATH